VKKKTIDVTDIEILNILAGHAELTNKELANKIGLLEGPTLVRVQNFWERGIIKSYGAIINPHLRPPPLSDEVRYGGRSPKL